MGGNGTEERKEGNEMLNEYIDIYRKRIEWRTEAFWRRQARRIQRFFLFLHVWPLNGDNGTSRLVLSSYRWNERVFRRRGCLMPCFFSFYTTELKRDEVNNLCIKDMNTKKTPNRKVRNTNEWWTRKCRLYSWLMISQQFLPSCLVFESWMLTWIGTYRQQPFSAPNTVPAVWWIANSMVFYFVCLLRSQILFGRSYFYINRLRVYLFPL